MIGTTVTVDAARLLTLLLTNEYKDYQELPRGKWLDLFTGWEQKLDVEDLKKQIALIRENKPYVGYRDAQSVYQEIIGELDMVINFAKLWKISIPDPKKKDVLPIHISFVYGLAPGGGIRRGQRQLTGVVLKSATKISSKIDKYYAPAIDIILKENFNLRLVGWTVQNEMFSSLKVKPFIKNSSLKELVLAAISAQQKKVDEHAEKTGTITTSALHENAPSLFK